MIDFAFYTAYYIGALLLFIFGNIRSTDLVLKWGYKKSIIFGLLFSAVGAAAMILAVEANVYIGMLIGLFIVALGFSLQQTAANPFAISLGDEKTGASRVTLGGGINSLGTTIGPLVLAFALFGTTAAVSDEAIKNLSLNKVIWLYVCVGLLFIGAALLFIFSKKLPNKTQEIHTFEKSNKAQNTLLILTALILACMVPIFLTYVEHNSIKNGFSFHELELYRLSLSIGAFVAVVSTLLFVFFIAPKQKKGWGAMQFPQLTLGMLAIFMYVGVEVAVGSNLGELLKSPAYGSLSTNEIAPYISLYWGSMMIGRWAGAVYAFNFSALKERLLIIGLPLLAFIIILSANYAADYEVSHLLPYIICVCLQILIILLTKNHAGKTLLGCALLGATAIGIGLATTGTLSIYAFLTAGLACSVIWPAIFNLSLMGLKAHTAQGSAFLIMMILGGGIIPPIQGKLADVVGIHNSYFISLACFIYLIIFSILVQKILKKQNVL